ncbi:MAG: polysaccharide deacetylase family protein [Negativicutes bacterium]|nr:polysaccharide deacetylase family protein [Negativicutes bacterium]
MITRTSILFFLFILLICPAIEAAEPVDGFPVGDKWVAVTVEDFADPADFGRILAVCREQGIKLTFFLDAQFIKEYAPLVKQAAEQGHQFGNHGLLHRYWGDVQPADIKKELADAHAIIEKTTGSWPQVFRPPYQYYEPKFFNAVSEIAPGALIIRGNDMADWILMTKEAVVEKAKTAAARGAILHFNYKVKPAVAALPEVIAALKRQGYKLVTVAELAAKAPPPARPLPEPRPRAKAEYYGAIYHVNVSRPLVALTFDDGGSPYNTGAILDALKANRAKATFFLLGRWVNDHPDLVRRMLAEGHEVANHSYSHPPFSRLERDEMQREIEAARTAVVEAAGQSPAPYFRPPYGSYNAAVTEVLRDLGYAALVMWDIDTHDWTGLPAWDISEQVLTRVSSGSIVLFHLHGANTPAAVEDIIRQLQAWGYQLATVGEMLQS